MAELVLYPEDRREAAGLDDRAFTLLQGLSAPTTTCSTPRCSWALVPRGRPGRAALLVARAALVAAPPALVCGALFLPVALPYLRVARAHAHERSLPQAMGLEHYFSTAPTNLVYGAIGAGAPSSAGPTSWASSPWPSRRWRSWPCRVAASGRRRRPRPEARAGRRAGAHAADRNARLHRDRAAQAVRSLLLPHERRREAGRRRRILRRLDFLAGRLRGNYLFGSECSVADAYLYVMLRWGRMKGLDLPEPLSAFAERMNTRPSVRLALQHEGLA